MSEDKILSDVIKNINKKYGPGTLMDLSNVDEREGVETISTGLPSLDLILGGGFPKGRIVELYGPESSGKSTMALHILKSAQEAVGDRKVAYIDAENAFDPNYAEKLGIDLSRLFLNQPQTGEEALQITETLCETNKISVIVIDSVPCLIPKAQDDKEIDGTAGMASTARMLAQYLPKIIKAASNSNTVIVFINQIRMKIGIVYGNPESQPGGMALKFAASIRLDLRGSKAEERDGREGMKVKFKVKKNKIAPPGRSTEIFLVFGHGFDADADLIETAVDFGVINKAGGWYSYGALKEQGMPSIAKAIRENPEAFAKLKEDLLALDVDSRKAPEEDEFGNEA